MSEHRIHHNTCPHGERCACYLAGYTDAEYDHGLALDALEPTKSELASSTGYLNARPSGLATRSSEWLDALEKVSRELSALSTRAHKEDRLRDYYDINKAWHLIDKLLLGYRSASNDRTHLPCE